MIRDGTCEVVKGPKKDLPILLKEEDGILAIKEERRCVLNRTNEPTTTTNTAQVRGHSADRAQTGFISKCDLKYEWAALKRVREIR
jgi:hypothetical protein